MRNIDHQYREEGTTAMVIKFVSKNYIFTNVLHKNSKLSNILSSERRIIPITQYRYGRTEADILMNTTDMGQIGK